MEKDLFVKGIIRASITWFLAWFWRIKNKRDFLLLENTLKKILWKCNFNNELIKKAYFEVLSDLDKKWYKLYQWFYKVSF